MPKKKGFYSNGLHTYIKHMYMGRNTDRKQMGKYDVSGSMAAVSSHTSPMHLQARGDVMAGKAWWPHVIIYPMCFQSQGVLRVVWQGGIGNQASLYTPHVFTSIRGPQRGSLGWHGRGGVALLPFMHL
jgi:hypothetical protein